MLWADIGLMAVVALLAVNAFAGSPQVWALYVLAAVGDLVLGARRAGPARDDARARPA